MKIEKWSRCWLVIICVIILLCGCSTSEDESDSSKRGGIGLGDPPTLCDSAVFGTGMDDYLTCKTYCDDKGWLYCWSGIDQHGQSACGCNTRPR